MVWDVLNVIGTLAFCISGALVAMEVKYDIIGIYILGLITAFGGGAVRNLMIGLPVADVWQQTSLFIIALIAMTLFILLPKSFIFHMKEWSIFDAIGLSAFAVQGAMAAQSMDMPLLAVMFSASITGAGGGIIRDVLAQKRPSVFTKEVYLLWAIMAGFIIGMDWITTDIQLYFVFGAILALRLLSQRFNWNLPIRNLSA
ncbi:trimeric intracellular cation channel family protein [Chryseomicrobium sp. FSL W7-1435]|uniref:trimeric intracellular cation channel family protein n=1 Tax=Chryseomicrobium sp. FSL W7-1435 TaxID=2921704 RepID=UPI003159D6F1